MSTSTPEIAYLIATNLGTYLVVTLCVTIGLYGIFLSAINSDEK